MDCGGSVGNKNETSQRPSLLTGRLEFPMHACSQETWVQHDLDFDGEVALVEDGTPVLSKGGDPG